MINSKEIIENVNQIREKSPLVHNITNYVVMNNTANALLAIGASPVMAHALNEVKDMASIASSLVINMGTLSDDWVEAMLLAGERAREREIPIVFDPVGAGATPYRTETALRIIKSCKPNIIRGNASEIMALVDQRTVTKGVDSSVSTNLALDSAKVLATTNKCVLVISGETDFITDGDQVESLSFGTPLMAKVTGMGCTATALLGAFAASNTDIFKAATCGMAVMGIVGELAEKKSNGPASMQMHFIDTLYQLAELDIEQVICKLI